MLVKDAGEPAKEPAWKRRVNRPYTVSSFEHLHDCNWLDCAILFRLKRAYTWQLL